MMKQKNILITGASGFIGFHLASFLKARGDEVVGLDNFNHYYAPELKRDREKQLREKGIPVIEGDICDGALLEQLLLNLRVTHIVHLAAQAGVRYSLVNPQAYIQSNVEGFLSILEICRRHPSIPLTYASSSSVYGTNRKIPFSIEDRTDHQASLYGVTKKTNELMAYTYHHLYGIRVTGLRFFTVYGPWGRPDMAYFSFTKAILEGKEIDVYHLNGMRRDFTYVDDIVVGIANAVDLEASYELFNLGNNNPESLGALISTIEEAVGKKARIRHLPMQSGDVESTYADITRSRQQLQFEPSISLKEGIPLFVKWYKSYTKI